LAVALEDKSERRVLRFNSKVLFRVVLLMVQQDIKGEGISSSFASVVTKLMKQTRIKRKTEWKEAMECFLVFNGATMMDGWMDVVMLVLL
jgi:hypothetical protein